MLNFVVKVLKLSTEFGGSWVNQLSAPSWNEVGENLTPHNLVCYVEIHLSLVKVQALVRISGTIIEFDAQSLPFGRELRFHDFISKGVSFGVLIIIGRVGLLSSSGSLMSLCLSRHLLLVLSVISQSRFLILFFEKAHPLFIPPLIFDAFLTHLLHLCLECLNYYNLLFSDPVVVNYVTH